MSAAAAESAEMAALYPRLRYLIEDIAGLTDCVALEKARETDAAKYAPASLRSPRSRAAFSRALRAHLELDPDFFQPPLGGALVALLQDSSGLVRRAAGRDIARVLTVFEREDQPAVMRAKILDRLSLGAALPDEDDPGPSSSRADETDAPADAREAAGADDDPPGGSDARGEEDPSDEERGTCKPGARRAFEPPLRGGAAASASAAACAEETAMLTLGHLAAASGAVEARCAYLLIAHAASKSEVASENSCGSPRAHALAQAADILSRLARSLGYASRRAFVARHRRAIGALWIRAGISVTRLFAVPELTATSDADAESPRALARSWTAALLPPAVLANNEDAARRVADARGESAEALLRENVACVFAQLFPASLSTSEARRRVAAAAKAALRGDLMIRAAGSAAASHVDALFFRHLTAAACEMLALAEPGGAESRGDGGADDDAAIRALTPPHFTPAELKRAGAALPDVFVKNTARRASEGGDESKTAAGKGKWSMWTGDRPFRCLLAAHRELDDARHPRHLRRALAGLGVLIDLLGDEALRPSTCRHAIHVLLPRVGDAAVGAEATRLLERVAARPLARSFRGRAAPAGARAWAGASCW